MTNRIAMSSSKVPYSVYNAFRQLHVCDDVRILGGHSHENTWPSLKLICQINIVKLLLYLLLHLFLIPEQFIYMSLPDITMYQKLLKIRKIDNSLQIAADLLF